MKFLKSSLLTIVIASAITAQPSSTPRFEVASIKVSHTGGNYVEVTPGAVVVHGATIRTSMAWAFGIQLAQINSKDADVSGLLDSSRFDILAKPGGTVPTDQLRSMLQNLLAERFKLAYRRQTRTTQVLTLLVDKNGPKFRESDPGSETKAEMRSKLTRKWTATPMSQITDIVAEGMRAPVIDQTGLKGKYDFSIDLTPYLPPPGEQRDIGREIPNMLILALKEQLGLKIESRPGTFEELIVDHLEMPSAN
jgi:uncharacterized protein (TIGR03435 family)